LDLAAISQISANVAGILIVESQARPRRRVACFTPHTCRSPYDGFPTFRAERHDGRRCTAPRETTRRRRHRHVYGKALAALASIEPDLRAEDSALILHQKEIAR